MEQLSFQGITDYRIWDGVEINGNPKKAITIGHKKIIENAKSNGLESVVVAEDDFIFFSSNKWHLEMRKLPVGELPMMVNDEPFCSGAWDYFLNTTPEKYHIYMAMVYVGLVDADNRLITTASGFTMYRVHSSFYDTFLSIPDDVHIDRHITAMHEKYIFKVCDKYVCYQDGSKSDNTKMQAVSYMSLIEDKKLFGRD